MERKISSSLTEFYKVYIIASVIIIVSFLGWEIFVSSNFLTFFFILMIGLNILMSFDQWRMKEVEMIDSGLLISKRLLFKQKTIFVPFEKIESVKTKLWWLGNNARISIKFVENTEFGKEISFIGKGWLWTERTEIVEELNRKMIRSKSPYQLT